MSRLFEVRDELRDLNAELARLERAVAADPDEDVLELDVASLSKRKRRLEEEFRTLAGSLGLDAVRYRLIPEGTDSVPLRALTKALDRFQEAITTFYDAKVSGIKQRGKIGPDARLGSSFDFAYSFSGSLGVVLTVPQERVLFDSALDKSITDFFAATQANTREQVVAIAHEYGVPAVRRLYEWSAAHADFGMSVDINWLRSKESVGRVEAAPEMLRHLKEIIAETSEVTDTPHRVIGMLHGLDTARREFHLRVVDADIQGVWSAHFTYLKEFALDEVYEAELIESKKVHFAIEREETKWFLLSLKKVTFLDPA